ncbi:MAG TPA: hypothetical protein VEG38_14795 [Acidimicrobiia bacterium]|nr:hypothetical protein [Acidimicrobiia bacterium]
MRSTRQRLAAVALLSGLTTVGFGLGLGATPASAAADEYCLGGAPNGSLQISTTPAAGSDVAPGSSITVDGSWNHPDFQETDRFVVCGSVNGAPSEALTLQDKGLDNDGQHTTSVTVPASAAEGSEVCLYGVVKGQLSSTGVPSSLMVSETECFRVASVAPTTTTTTTTAPAPVVDPEVVEAGNNSAPAVEAAPAPVTEPAPLPVLPRTGAGIDLLAGFGGLVLAAGGVARFFGRRS